MNWEKKKIGDLVELSRGYNPPKNQFVNAPKEGFVRFYQIRDGKSDDYATYVPESPKLRRVAKRDILMVAYRHIGGVFRGVEGAFNVALCKLSDWDENVILGDYLYAIIPTDFVKGELLRASERSLIPSMSVKHLAEIEIPLPPLSEQKRIVAILDKAFAAIDEAKAKAEQNLKNARELFDSYLQQVSGEKKSLGEFVNIKTGKLNSNAAVDGGEYPFFTCSRDIFAINQYSFDCEAILLAGNNASGDFNVKHYKGKFDAYQRTYVITINDDTTLLYPFLYYQMLKSLKELKASSVGAGTKFLKLGMIKNLKISIPPIQTQREIVGTLLTLKGDVDKLENIYNIKIESLNELKKSLLQKAFSGELTANQAEEAVA